MFFSVHLILKNSEDLFRTKGSLRTCFPRITDHAEISVSVIVTCNVVVWLIQHHICMCFSTEFTILNKKKCMTSLWMQGARVFSRSIESIAGFIVASGPSGAAFCLGQSSHGCIIKDIEFHWILKKLPGKHGVFPFTMPPGWWVWNDLQIGGFQVSQWHHIFI